ncbi:histidine--tRNA ligase [Candidatus Daviesbacteria bacterium]|nr:histidine--tRNA ligase [Candidatus Daviesbacteria bacterium]
MKLQTPKGFRDFLPQDALKRKAVLDRIISIYQKFGFDPLETPTVEYEETLKGKYGEEEKLIYSFETLGGDKLALRYDQTVPLVRVIAQWGPAGAQKIILPFKRYQIQSAFRGENPQKGRYREFLQCDADTIGISSPLVDAELLALAYEIYQSLGLEVIIKVNDRALLSEFTPKHLSAIDKLNKIGTDGVISQLESKGMTGSEAAQALEKIKSLRPSENLGEAMKTFEKMGYPKNVLKFDPTLVRGLDYYTGMIMEVVLKEDANSQSLAGGGRYDKIIGQFTGTDIPASGFSVGFDRTIEVLEQKNLIEPLLTNTLVLIALNSPSFEVKALKVLSLLRSLSINTEIWLDSNTKLEKQLKFADLKGIQYVVIIGLTAQETEDEVILKDLLSRTQETVRISEIYNKVKSSELGNP